MTPLIAAGVICDRHGCPAPAQRVVLIHGQDFYFCGHHASEMEGAFAASAATEIVLAKARARNEPVSLAWRQDVVPAGAPTEEW